jgi:preprotein translocase subunit SecY
MKSKAGRAKFMGTQKILIILFALFEAWAYVNFGVVRPVDSSLGTLLLLVGQLAFGGFVVLLMDEVVTKWGIGSGVSLFIAAGVTKTIFVRTLNPLTPAGSEVAAGILPAIISYMRIGELNQAFLSLLPLIATIVIFLLVIYIQAIRVDIPLAFTSIRGFGRRWPLKFIYTSNMPVILTAALLANMMLMGSMLANHGIPILGTFDANGQAVDGIMYLLSAPMNVSIQLFILVWLGITFAGSFIAFYKRMPGVGKITVISGVAGFVAALVLTMGTVGLPLPMDIVRIVCYLTFFMVFCAIFSIIWVTTSGMDAESVANQIEDLGLQVPGFRRDPRIIREILNRYIPTLSVLGGLAVGGLAAFADLTHALGTGTGILLTVMIIYSFYETIAARYAEEMHPALRGLFK